MQILKRFFLCGSIISSIFVLPKKNFITPIHRGISAISSKFLPSKIYANMYTRSIFQIIFFKKSVILPIKGRQKMPKAWKDAPCSKYFFHDFYFDHHTNGTFNIWNFRNSGFQKFTEVLRQCCGNF